MIDSLARILEDWPILVLIGSLIATPLRDAKKGSAKQGEKVLASLLIF